MIGPSSGTENITNRDLPDSQSRLAKKRVFEEIDIDRFCEEICQNSRKRQLQALENPLDLIGSNQVIGDGTALFSSLSTQEAMDECPVAHLEVFLVDGTNYTWTTVSDLEQHNSDMITSPSTSSSSTSSRAEHRLEHGFQEQVHAVHETNQVDQNYWESVAPVVTIPSSLTHKRTSNNIPVTSNNQQSQQQFDDQETGNLSWLLDFKLDPFIEAADDRSVVGPPFKDNHHGMKTKFNGRAHRSTVCASNVRSCQGGHENGTLLHQDNIQMTYSNPDNRNLGSSRCGGPKKPPFTYTELIEHALQERGELTVSAIYQWISEHFPYYKSNDDRWKNSVRHNLSINPHFRKGSKAPHGAGHLWAIANRDAKPRQIITSSTATSATRRLLKNTLETEHPPTNGNHVGQMIPIDEVTAATASIMQQTEEEETDNIMDSVTLEHCAEQILSGIKKEVEVQYLVPMMVSNGEHNSPQVDQQVHTEFQCPIKESDFLNPVSKEVVAEECGLISEGYLVTDLNPTTLGLNMIESETISPENLFGEELSFQFYELTSPSQIQSA